MFKELKVGDRVKTNLSGMATVIEVGCYNGTMIKLKCDKKNGLVHTFMKVN